MAKMIYDADVDMSALERKAVAVLGYGSQGHAHALNLHESGIDVRVGLREGSGSWGRAADSGLAVKETGKAVAESDVIMVLVPDQLQRGAYQEQIGPNLAPGNALAFAHGFNIHFGYITPPDSVDVFMIAPKGPGHLVRRTYEEGGGTPALVAIHADATGAAHSTALAYAKGIGATRAGVIETTFAEETETDLFGEQAVLCGGLTRLILAGYETLVDAGYQPEVAYFECMHETKLIVDLLYEGGFSRMRDSISDTAEYGDLSRGDRVITKQTKDQMKELLAEIRNGSFAKEWVDECDTGQPNFSAMRKRAQDHPIESVGGALRAMMPWLRR